LGVLSDLFHGLVAVFGLVIGGIVGDALYRAFNSNLIVTFILAIIGLVVAGFGLKRRSYLGSFVAGFGLGIAVPVTRFINSLLT
jgi:hypothetical protein